MTEPDPMEPPSAAAPGRNRPAGQRRQHDERVKLLFSHERPVRELLVHMGALPEGREVRLVRWNTEWIRLQAGADDAPARLARALGDQVWLVCEMDGRPLGTALLEFKADHDPDVARQITLYLFDLWQDARRLAALRTGADAVPTRAALIHTGPTRWTADLSLPAVGPDGAITPRPGIFLLDVGQTAPDTFPEDSLLAHIIPLERCRGRLQWERGVDEAAVLAEAGRRWEALRLLAKGDDSLQQVLLDWLRSGFADYIQGTKLEGRGEDMYATMSEAYAARRAEEAQRITERVTISASISLLTDYVRERHGDAAGGAVAAFLADWQDSRLPTFSELDALAEVHRNGQDLHAWWAERRRSETPHVEANGRAPTQSLN